MSFIGSMFGQNGTGLNFRAQSAPLQTPTTDAQAKEAYAQSQDALAKQQQFLQALQGQNGIQNQSDVFNQLQGVANGTGPNPAQAMLNQSTGANVANQAALMAGQRGSSANAGLIARQAAQQGGALQQQAAGQGATLQANQSLAALNQLGGIAGQQVGQQQQATAGLNQFAQGNQGQILGAIQGQNQAQVANTSQMNQANAGIAGAAAGMQGQILGGLLNGAGAAAAGANGGMVRMAEGGAIEAPSVNDAKKPKSAVGNFLSGSTGQPGMYQGSASFGAGLGAGIKSLFGSPAPVPGAPSPMPTANDWSLYARTPEGAVPSPEANYSMMKSMPNMVPLDPQAPSFNERQAAKGPDMGMPDASLYHSESAQPLPPKGTPPFAQGGQVKALLSAGERYLSPQKVEEVKARGNKPGDAIQAGEKIEGTAKVKGDSYANDTIPKTLEEGGIVLPRSVTQSKNAPEEAAKFVRAYMAKGGLVGGSKKRKK